MAILKNGRTVAGDWRYENIVDKPLINGNEIKENNNSSVSLEIFKVVSKAEFEAPTFVQNPQCVYAVIDTDENIRFHYTNQLESTDPNYKKYVCKDYWPVEELPAEPAVTEVNENIRLSSILYWLKKTYKHPTTEEVYLPGLYGWVPTLEVTTPQTYEWRNLGGIDVDKKTIFASEEGVISAQVGGYHDPSGTTSEIRITDNANPVIISQNDDYTLLFVPVTNYEYYTPNTKYVFEFNYQTQPKSITYLPTKTEEEYLILNPDTGIAVIGVPKSEYPSTELTDYTSCTLKWDKPNAISYINSLYFPLDLQTLRVEKGKITTITPFYELNFIRDDIIDDTQLATLQLILNDVLINKKVVTSEYDDNCMLLSSAQVGTDGSGTFITLASTLNDDYTLIKLYYNPDTKVAIGARRYVIQPIKHSVIDPGVGSYLNTDCIIAVCEDERKISFVSKVPFNVGTQVGWAGDGTVEVSIDYGETWQDATSTTGGVIAEQTTPIAPDQYEIYVRGVNNTKLNNYTTDIYGDRNENDKVTTFTVNPLTSGDDLDLEVRGNIIYLLDYKRSTTIDTNLLFITLFANTPIVRANKLILPQETMGKLSYGNMFLYCTKLVEPPELPSTELAPGCYNGMFIYCVSLTKTPELPATVLPEVAVFFGTEYGCYEQMFSNCLNLKTVCTLPATNITKRGYCNMFSNSGLITTPVILATDIDERGCTGMFYSCNNLIEVTNLFLKNLGKYACAEMFAYCRSLVKVPDTLPFVTVDDNGCIDMFSHCEKLTTAPALTADTVGYRGYYCMFYGCTSLTTAPGLPATTLGNSACEYMFYCCSNLVSMPSLSATTLGTYVCRSMFHGCEKLTTAPTLPATTLFEGCYAAMFVGCISLETPPTLPATQLVENCYASMFGSCISLKTAPALPSTTLASSCYANMFSGCTSLTVAPELPATTLVNNCYGMMFNGCSSLIEPPEIPATTLAQQCCYSMFGDCTSIQKPADIIALKMEETCFCHAYDGCTNIYWGSTGITYRIPKSGSATEASEWNLSMFANNSGSLPEGTGTPLINKEYHYIPTTTLTFYNRNGVDNLTVTNKLQVNLKYSIDDGATWADLAVGAYTPEAVKVIIKGPIEQSEATNTTRLKVVGSDVAVKGQLNDNISYKYLFYDNTALKYADELTCASNLVNNIYESMFEECTSLETPPILPALALSEECYSHMFYNCESLKTAPQLTSMDLSYRCYYYMFRGCISLTAAPELPATTLANGCYEGMFQYCAFESTPELPSTLLDKSGCYEHMFSYNTNLKNIPSVIKSTGKIEYLSCSCMFEECTSIISCPRIEANHLEQFSCWYMFKGCTSLKTASEIIAPSVGMSGLGNMFRDCTSLETPPTLSFTTMMGVNCCVHMFDGCTSLTSAPTLSCTALTNNCYGYMFKNCKALTSAPALPAETLTEECYQYMFQGCTSLETAPEISATALDKNCCLNMFDGCTSLIKPPTLLATQMAENCYNKMFYNCSNITWTSSGTAYRLPYSGEGTEATGWNTSMFTGNGGQVPEGTGTPVINKTYYLAVDFTELTFANKNSGTADVVVKNYLNTAAKFSLDDGATWTNLPIGSSTTPASSKVIIKAAIDNTTSTFENPLYLEVSGTNVEVIGQLLDGVNYNHLFTKQPITDASGLVGGSMLVEKCYEGMFRDCKQLRIGPNLPATALTKQCYINMFSGCENLTIAPVLPATIMGEESYAYMFNGCDSLITIPELPATTLDVGCYQYMFQDCTSLNSLPELKVLETKDNCYLGMFNGCEQFVWGGGIPYRLPSTGTGTAATNWSKNMFAGNSGVLPGSELESPTPGTPVINTEYKYCLEGTIIFTGAENFTITNNLGYEVYYSTSLTTPVWNIIKNGETTTASTTLVFKEVVRGNLSITSAGFVVNGSNITVEGSLVTGNNYSGLFLGQNGIINASNLNLGKRIGEHGCDSMFKGCRGLVTGPKCSAVIVESYGYSEMFRDCSRLTSMSEISAEIIPEHGCFYMYNGCLELVTPAEIKARVIREAGCMNMFTGCVKLETPPELSRIDAVDEYGCYGMFETCLALTTPAKLASLRTSAACYQYMFRGCTALKTLPEIPAIDTSGNCYYGMFEGCKAVEDVLPDLSALSMSNDCYSTMFYNCDQYIWGKGAPYRIPYRGTGTATEGLRYANAMFGGNSGTLPEGSGTPVINTIYKYIAPGMLVFETEVGEIQIKNNLGYDIYYSIPDVTDSWVLFKNEESISTTSGIIVLKRVVKGGTSTTTAGLEVTGDEITVSGKLVSEGNYSYLFYGLTSLISADDLVGAGKLTAGSYISMFEGCSNLQIPMSLPATIMANDCYKNMFKNCSEVCWSTKGSSYRLPTSGTGTEATGWNTEMFIGNSGTLPGTEASQAGTPVINTTYYYLRPTTLTFESRNTNAEDVVITNKLKVALKYSTDNKATWTDLPIGESTPAAAKVYIRGLIDQSDAANSNVLGIEGTDVAVSGQLQNGLCYKFLFYNQANLKYADGLIGASILGVNYAYDQMFCMCTSLITPPTLPAKDTTSYCYSSMFNSCSSLESAPELPATSIKSYCYQYMFYRCASLTTAPNLPASTTADACYQFMFSGSGIVTGPSSITASTANWYSCRQMFAGCVNLKTAPNLSFYTVGSYGCTSMFSGCVALETAPTIKITQAYNQSCQYMFDACSSLKTAPPSISPSYMMTKCFYCMFRNCTSLVTPPVLGGKSLNTYCYQYMFQNCISLETPPALPATTLSQGCYSWMFHNCKALKTTPTLPASTLAVECYYSMFNGCEALTEPCEITATSVAKNSCRYMFANCLGLTRTVRSLPVTTLAEGCYASMFDYCSSITEVLEELPATTAAVSCYEGFLYHCTGIKKTPKISLTTLAKNCCYGTFNGCTSLEELPELAAIEMAETSYKQMFDGCTGIAWSGSGGTNYRLPKEGEGVEATNWSQNMFANNMGKLPGTEASQAGSPVINTTYYYDKITTLTFESRNTNAADVVITNNLDTILKYSVDNGTTWVDLTNGSATPAAAKVIIKGNLCNVNTGSTGLGIAGTYVAVSGQLRDNSTYRNLFLNQNKLMYADGLIGASELPSSYAYNGMFEGCSLLRTAPQLPATTMKENCYNRMFAGCSNLTTAPALPAETLASSCYYQMFADCSVLEHAPTLPAMTLEFNCYREMFLRCGGLRVAPALPATNLANSCYRGMFSNCINLTAAPELPATRLIQYCYTSMFLNSGITSTPAVLKFDTSAYEACWSMFAGCSGLTTAPRLECNTVANYCYEYMFSRCTSLKTAAEIVATEINYCGCYYMYNGCTSLTTVPVLPATGLGEQCYQKMFYNCTSLETVPTNLLPAETVPDNGYACMFENCSKLTAAPELPATTLNHSCYSGMFRNCTSIKNLPVLKATQMAENCYGEMFNGCNQIYWGYSGVSYRLPSTGTGTEATNWSVNMFANNSGTLPGEGTPAINTVYYYVPETTLTFESRNTNAADAVITNNLAVALKYSVDNGTTWVDLAIGASTPASSKVIIRGYIDQTNASNTNNFNIAGTNISVSGQLQDGVNYKKLFYGQPKLKYADGLIGASTLGVNNAYETMFYGCSTLETPPTLPATTMTVSCYRGMFMSCTALKTAPVLPAMAMNTYSYYNMFNGCTALTAAPELPATKLADFCYGYMFYGSGIVTGPSVIKANAAVCESLWRTFANCKSLKTAPRIEIPRIESYGCEYMFAYCTALETAPEITTTTVYNYACQSMFEGCTSLVTPPPTLAFNSMMDHCCYDMFKGCTKLTSCPSLPSTKLKAACYYRMFANCKSLTIAPALPATNLANQCYSYMFMGCTSLEVLPTLSATTMAQSCYANMFDGCTSITWGSTGVAYRLPSEGAGTEATDWSANMFANNSGSLPGGTGTPLIDTTYNYIPPTTLTFEGRDTNAADVVIKNNLQTALKYSVDNGTTWVDLAIGASTPASSKVIIKGAIEQSSAATGNTLGITGTNIAVSGKFLDNISYKYLFYGQGNLKYTDGLTCASNIGVVNAYQSTFQNCTGLTTAPILPATTLTNYCYWGMFNGCKALATAPVLPAEVTTHHCYSGMFCDCTALKTAPQLNASIPTEAECCYEYMFSGCTSLTAVPDLPSETLSNFCYQYMFQNCTSLTTGATLPATQLTYGCYQFMFNGCKSINTIPTLRATNLSDHCYDTMYCGCEALTTVSEDLLPATTLKPYCYAGFFKNCINLKKGPKLPATNLSNNSCWYMFEGCKSLEFLPQLPALGMAKQCYQGMFLNNTNITWGEVGIPYRIPTSGNGTSATNYARYMFQGNKGDLPGGGWPALNTTYHYIPDQTTVLVFESRTSSNDVVVKNNINVSTMRYTINEGVTWTKLNPDASTPASNKVTIIFDNVTALTGYAASLSVTGTEIIVSGKVADGLRWECGLRNNANIVDASKLKFPETLTGTYSFGSFFEYCRNLEYPPQLPATNLQIGCYQYMFNECVSLKEAPELPATTLKEYCYYHMFHGCILLTKPVTLKALTLSNNCYNSMFYGCTGITWGTSGKEYRLPAEGTGTGGTNWNTNMFYGNSGTLPGGGTPVINTTYYLPIETTLGFESKDTNGTVSINNNLEVDLKYSTDDGATWIDLAIGASTPYVSKISIKGYINQANSVKNLIVSGSNVAVSGELYGGICYKYLLRNQTSIKYADGLIFPDKITANNAFQRMFDGCSSLLTVPAQLPATTLTEYCYSDMFTGCKSLVTPPELPATTLAPYCYSWMFYECKALKTAPALPAMDLTNANNCYYVMFDECISLETPPDLPATVLSNNCYSYMFTGCTGLKTAPALPATTATQYCYMNMFKDCTSLKTPPALPATTLNVACYSGMFQNCTNLSKIPDLPATTLVASCYANMFNGCSKIYWITVASKGFDYRIPTKGTGTVGADNWGTNMFANTKGSIPGSGTPSINSLYYYIPETTFIFESRTGATDVAITNNSAQTLQYSTDNGLTWEDIPYGSRNTAASKVIVRGALYNNSTSTATLKVYSGTNVAVSGELENEIDYKYFFASQGRILYADGLKGGTILTNYCYSCMFSGCSKLTTPPQLPATTLAIDCYGNMFSNCRALKTAPELPATELVTDCYIRMFYRCTSLTTPPQLPATTLANWCYQNMFNGCTSLTTPPILPATTLTQQCYESMFENCTGITWTTDTSATPYRLPSSGSGTTATEWNTDMFATNSGTLPGTEAGSAGTPSINTTYYYVKK